jgi:hypothetical protein
MHMTAHSDLEIARATISAVMCTDPGNPSKVHYLRVEHLARTFGLSNALMDSLVILKDVREIQDLNNAYWITSPPRSVCLGEEWLIVSCLPTQQLKRDLELIPNLGHSRTARGRLDGFPEQSLYAWMGAPSNLEEWLTIELAEAKKNLSPTVVDVDDLEFYLPWNRRAGVNTALGNWAGVKDLSADDDNKIILARSKDPGKRTYTWCQVDGQELYESTVGVKKRIVRIQFALERINGAEKRHIYISRTEGGFKFTCRFPMPEEERRLFIAIGVESKTENDTTYSFHTRHEALVRSLLNNLGIGIDDKRT